MRNQTINVSGVHIVGDFRSVANFVDNRWLYVDSIQNDTTFVGAILYGENAPYGYNLTRFIVDLSNETSGINVNGVQIAGTFNSWNTSKNRLISPEK